MNKEQLEGKWRQFKGDVQAKWAELTDDDLNHLSHDLMVKKDKLVGLIQDKYGKAKEVAEHEVDEFKAKVDHYFDDYGMEDDDDEPHPI